MLINIFQIYSRNNIIYLKCAPEYYDWCQEDAIYPDLQYFPLNKVTRKHFIKDILPLIQQEECDILDADYDLIKNFRQNPELTNVPELIEPPGITFTEDQRTGALKLLTHQRFGLFFGTGTGKTLIAISILLSRDIRQALIVTKAKVVAQYKEELDKYIPDNDHIVTSYGMLSHHLCRHYECMILDESHMAKNYMSETNVLCRQVAANCKYVYLFTGTPQDKQRHEILAQIAILDPRVMPVKTRIYNRYFRLNDYYQPKSENKKFSEELSTIIRDYTWGKQSEDILGEIKAKEYIIECPHPNKYYDDLHKDRVLEKPNDLYCVADSPSKLRLFLREICCGIINWTNLNNEVKEKQVFKSSKYTALYHCIRLNKQAIIYYEFTKSLDEIKEALTINRRSFVTVNGQTSKTQAAKNCKAFKENKVDYIVLQSRSGDAGLDFYNAHVIIFYALPESYIVFHQCRSRITRYNQTKECIYFYLLCKDTVEDNFIFKSLKNKKSATDKLYENYLRENTKWKTKTLLK